MALQGIDVSNWKDVDVAKARDFVVVQTTWGVGGFNNTNLVDGVSLIADRQYQAAKAAGKRRAFMHYYMGGDPAAEADFAHTHNRGYVGDGILMLDWEAGDNRFVNDAGRLEAVLTAFGERFGGPGVVYYQQSLYAMAKPIADRHDWGSFVAQYASMDPTGIQESPWNEGAYECALRQYTSNGRIGAGTAVDLDKFYGDEAAWDRYAAALGRGGSPTPTPTPQPQPQPSAVTYTVQPGDTLSAIAARFGVGVGAVSGYRSGNPSLIYPGEVLTINGANPGAGGATYTVQPGDTLSAIAAAHHTTWQHLAALNRLADPDLIHPGQQIRLN